jgi:DNA-binding MurR/RpiR family transcriptional regulator
VNNILNVMKTQMPKLSKGHKKIAQYIIDHYEKASYMTASKLGQVVGVSESTVVRFACEIGLDGYPELQSELQEIIRNKLTAVQRMEVTTEQIGENDVLEKVLNSDIDKIKKTLESTSKQDFSQAVDSLVEAKNIYILGVRSSSALARFLSFYFTHIFESVILVETTSASEMFEKIMRISENDVLIGISFPRYSRRTAKAFSYAKECGAKTIAITDSNVSPIAEKADYALLARSDMASFVDSLVAPLSLINALIVAVGLKKRDEVTNTFNKLEKIWDEYDVYAKNEETK